jgi:hypothetical protein
MGALVAATIAILLLGGCTFKRTPVMYWHPGVGVHAHCFRPPAFALGPADVAEWNRFADCKTALEARGFVREGPAE